MRLCIACSMNEFGSTELHMEREKEGGRELEKVLSVVVELKHVNFPAFHP